MEPLHPSSFQFPIAPVGAARPLQERIGRPERTHRQAPPPTLSSRAAAGLDELQRALGTGVGRRASVVAGAGAAIALGVALIRKGGGGDGAASSRLEVGASPGSDAATSAADETRREITETASALIKTRDIDPDGSLNDRVRGWKSATVDGRPDDANAGWEVAFATAVTNAAGAPLGVDGKGAATALDLQEWAKGSGHFRPATDTAARAEGNLVLTVRKDARGLTWHDVGVVLGATKDGTGLVVVSGNRLAGDTAKVGGKDVYVGTVGYETIALDATLEGAGHQIEGFIDVVSAPLPVAAPAPVDPRADEVRVRGEMVARAAAKVGVAETSHNSGPEVDGFWKSTGGDVGIDPGNKPWCAAFVSWVYNEGRMPFFDRDGHTGTSDIRQWAVDNGIWHTRSSGYVAQPGDLIGFKGSRNDRPLNHIGIVEFVDPVTKRVHTIEGNTGDGSQVTEGDGVYRKVYEPTDPYIRGYVNVFEYYAKHPEGPK